MDIPKLEYILGCIKGRTKEVFIKKQYPEFYSYLQEKFPEPTKPWSKKLYWYYHGLNSDPICPICHKNTCKYRNFVLGYFDTCSNKCSGTRADIIEQRKQTCLKKYGGVAPACSAKVKEKFKQTCLDKYGTTSPLNNSEIRNKGMKTFQEKWGGIGMSSDQIKQKIEQTKTKRYGSPIYNNIKKTQQTISLRYGVENISQLSDIKDKKQQTCLEHYGVRWPGQSDEVKDKIKQTNIERYGVECVSQMHLFKNHPDIISFRGSMWKCKCPHPQCNKCEEKWYEIHSSKYHDRKRDGTELCTRIQPIGDCSSTIERLVREYVLSLGVECSEKEDRQILKGKGLDIYIPNCNLAIEVNGSYWHSDIYKDRYFHIDKYINCKQQNIQLLQIWGDWIKLKPEIVQSLISAKLGIFEHRTGASKCKIQSVDKKTAQEFLEQNHIQGRCGCQINYGLYYKGVLVSLMTFGKRRPGMGGKTATEGQYELLRFCNLKGWQVVHGAERMLHHFIQDYQPKEIISFSSNDISNGDLYKKLGFETDGKIESSYWYIEPHTEQRYHRFSFNKYQIVSKGLAPDPDPSKWTEREVMDFIGYYRIYDSGTTKWTLKLK